MKTNLREKLEELKEEYSNKQDEKFIEEANGSLSKLCNLRTEFDETFDKMFFDDMFFDNEELRKKYNAWDLEEDCINLDISNADLEEKLDYEDLERLIKFYENAIAEL